VREELAARLQLAASGAEAQAGAAHATGGLDTALASSGGSVGPQLDLPMYAIDPIVRRAEALQRTRDGRAALQTYEGGGS
jgi:hypothetical protein